MTPKVPPARGRHHDDFLRLLNLFRGGGGNLDGVEDRGLSCRRHDRRKGGRGGQEDRGNGGGGHCFDGGNLAHRDGLGFQSGVGHDKFGRGFRQGDLGHRFGGGFRGSGFGHNQRRSADQRFWSGQRLDGGKRRVCGHLGRGRFGQRGCLRLKRVGCQGAGSTAASAVSSERGATARAAACASSEPGGRGQARQLPERCLPGHRLQRQVQSQARP